MNWNEIVVLLGGTGSIVAGGACLLKSSFEHLLDVRLKRIEEQNRAAIEELLQRQATLFDEPFSMAKTALSLVYRARNSAREVREHFASLEKHRVSELVKRLESY
jgi:hypothetical protein